MKHYFIINPIAGPIDSTPAIKKLIDENFTENDDYEIYITKESYDAYRFVKDICDKTTEDVMFYAGGGDGTSYEVINGIAECDKAYFTVLPFGSCNDFLKVFPNDDFKDLKKLKNGQVMKIDLLKINDFYAINVLNAGFDALINYDACIFKEKMDIHKAYNKAVLKNTLHKKGIKTKVSVDGKEVFNDKMLMVAIANGHYYGGGYHCAPKALVDDGLADICIFKDMSILDVATMIGKYKQGLHLEDKKIQKKMTYLRGEKITIDTESRLCFCLDGETIWGNHFDIEILKHKINFVLPR